MFTEDILFGQRFLACQGLYLGKLDGEAFDLLLAGAGIGGEAGAAPDVPEATAGINAILNVCPPELAERVLVEFFNRLYVPDSPR